LERQPMRPRCRRMKGQMVKLRLEKKPAPPTITRVLPMHLQVGDRLADETGERQVIGRPYATSAGKDAHVRVKKVGQPEVTEIRTWVTHERVSVRRA
jgi:hypothetical protein